MRTGIVTLSLALAISTAYARGPKKVVPEVIPPAFTTESILIADLNGNIFREQDQDVIRPIASISKLMVGILASEQDLDEQLTIPKDRKLTTTIPRSINTLSRNELLTLALVRSDNLAAQVLCENILNCVESMNDRAMQIGMFQTHYNEPTGLDRGNVSTASDLLKLIIVAANNHIITSLSSLPIAELLFQKKPTKIYNTNPLTHKLDVILSKTGFTSPAGGCLVMMVNSPVGQRILILLGSRNAKTRIPAMEKLYKEM
jgi:serine-type D-Ala-D-Ala endopeptidase (penicillin-binding protein 7)